MGRPRLDPGSQVPSADVHLKLSAADYDRAHAAATRDRLTINEYIRRTLRAASGAPAGRPLRDRP